MLCRSSPIAPEYTDKISTLTKILAEGLYEKSTYIDHMEKKEKKCTTIVNNVIITYISLGMVVTCVVAFVAFSKIAWSYDKQIT